MEYSGLVRIDKFTKNISVLRCAKSDGVCTGADTVILIGREGGGDSPCHSQQPHQL